jgi:hypothetical protein
MQIGEDARRRVTTPDGVAIDAVRRPMRAAARGGYAERRARVRHWRLSRGARRRRSARGCARGRRGLVACPVEAIRGVESRAGVDSAETTGEPAASCSRSALRHRELTTAG